MCAVLLLLAYIVFALFFAAVHCYGIPTEFSHEKLQYEPATHEKFGRFTSDLLASMQENPWAKFESGEVNPHVGRREGEVWNLEYISSQFRASDAGLVVDVQLSSADRPKLMMISSGATVFAMDTRWQKEGNTLVADTVDLFLAPSSSIPDGKNLEELFSQYSAEN